ncbi:HNH endonuclease, partial [Abditibacterium utsteinense]
PKQTDDLFLAPVLFHEMSSTLTLLLDYFPGGRSKRYSIVPPEYANDFVRFIENFQSVPDWKLLDVIESTERILGELGAIEEPPEGGGISTSGVKIGGSEDFEERIPVSIKRRRGQANFRNSLRGAYNDTCAITKCNSHHALEAAHISPYRNVSSNSITNGILLRADIHSLFDLNLIAIDEDAKIILSELIRKTPSGERSSYDYLHGQLAKLPAREEHYPDKVALRERLKQLRP